MTPYNYVGGNPIAFNDPLGDDMFPNYDEDWYDANFGGGAPHRNSNLNNAIVGGHMSHSYSGKSDAYYALKHAILDNYTHEIEYHGYQDNHDNLIITGKSEKWLWMHGNSNFNKTYFDVNNHNTIDPMGITVRHYKDFEYFDRRLKNKFRGVDIHLGGNADSQFKKLRWIQTINTNDPRSGESVNRYIDGPRDGSARPYLYSERIADGFRNHPEHDLIMYDKPRRASKNRGKVIEWRAEISLVGEFKGGLVIIDTITYGFDINLNGELIRHPWSRVTSPSEFHIDALY